MGCASSTPMVQTAGSDMLKAATHVADDATKTAEDAIQGVKDSLGKTLDTAKETVTTTVEEVKHEAENTFKEKAGQLDEAKNSLMEKLHLGSNTATEAASAAATASKENVLASKTEAEMDMKSASETVKQSAESMLNRSDGDVANDMESVVAGTDTETDSLKTSTPEPEIERAMANTKKKSAGYNEHEDGDDDDNDNDNPPTPIPTFSELENLSNELLSQQSHKAVNDLATTNNPLMMMTDEGTSDNTTTTATTTSSTTTNSNTTISSNASVITTLDTTNSSAMHITPIPIASATSVATAIASSTASALHLSRDPHSKAAKEPLLESESLTAQAAKSKAQKRDERVTIDRAKQRKLIQKLQDEKRPGTTEWEKYADMLALFRKFNPHDAFRRGGTLTKFNGHHFGALPIRERGLHGRAPDDDSSDTTSNRGRGSPALRSSAGRLRGRVHQQTNRPNSANQRSTNGLSARRNSAVANGGRKFDYNPNRSRLNNGQASNVSSGQNFALNSAYRLSPTNGTHLHSQLHSHSASPSPKHESVKSPAEMRSQHTHLGTNSSQRLEPLHQQQLEQLQNAQQSNYGKLPTHPHLSSGGSSMPPDAIHSNLHSLTPLTRESSNTSLSSPSPFRGHIRSFKSTHDLTATHALYPPARNTSSFLTTPRTSPFYLTKSYTDLYFSSSNNKENNETFQTDLSSIAQQRHVRDKSPYKIRERCEVCSKKYIKT